MIVKQVAINYRNILAREIEMKMEIMGIMEKLLDTTVALLRGCWWWLRSIGLITE
jgi:hypothetical protein